MLALALARIERGNKCKMLNGINGIYCFWWGVDARALRINPRVCVCVGSCFPGELCVFALALAHTYCSNEHNVLP